MGLQSVTQEATSRADVFSVLVLAAGYHSMVKLYRERVHMRSETQPAGNRRSCPTPTEKAARL